MTRPSAGCVAACFFVLLYLFFAGFIWWYNTQRIDLVAVHDNTLVISDLAYYIALVKAFWFDGITGIYRSADHLKVLSEISGSRVSAAMPLGITPLCLIIFFPFAWVARTNLVLACSLWSALAFVVWLGGVLALNKSVKKNLQGKDNTCPPTFLLFALLTVSSFVMISALLIGQFSVLSSGLILLLMAKLVSRSGGSPRKIHAWEILALFILAMKPPTFILAALLLFLFGEIRAVVWAALLAAAALLIMTPKLGTTWVTEYLESLRVFSGTTYPAVYARAFDFRSMNLFRGAFRQFVGENAALQISNLISVGVVLAVIIFAVSNRGRRLIRGSERYGFALFALALSTYLLFAPYAGGYEDVLITVVIGAAFAAGYQLPCGIISTLPMLGFLLTMNHTRFGSERPLWIFWLLKAGLLIYFVYQAMMAARRVEKT